MDQLVKELHRPVRKHFPRRKVIVLSLNDLWQADLVEMIPYADLNEGFNYLLTCINVMSKYAWAIPLKNKTGPVVTAAFKKILAEAAAPKNLQVDSGGEFYNKSFKALVKKYKINMYSSYSEKKASVVERFNRTLKTIMWRRFTLRGKYKWVDILDELVSQYNNTVHSTTKLKPSEVTVKHESRLRRLGIKKLLAEPKFTVGTKVRISKMKKIFDKGYLQNFTDEVFTIRKVQKTDPVTYLLKDQRNEVVLGGFYEQELQKTLVPDLFLVEEVIRTRKNKKTGKTQYFVKWKGHDAKHNSWTDKVDDLS